MAECRQGRVEGAVSMERGVSERGILLGEETGLMGFQSACRGDALTKVLGYIQTVAQLW